MLAILVISALFGFDFGGLQGSADGFEVLRVTEDLPMRTLIIQVFRARLEDDFHELVFVRGIFIDCDDALFC